MFSSRSLISFASLLAVLPSSFAAFSSSSSSNVAVYWGQNSYGQGSGPYVQQRLSYYCANTDIDVIPIGFLTNIVNPQLNFASAGDSCTTFPGTNLLNCPQIAADIATCQTTYKKKILLSIGGATYTEGGFSSSSAAISAANNIWALFGPQTGSSSVRPFGSTAVDGFDFDFESGTQNMAPFASQLRTLMDANASSTGKKWMLTAAPQCPYPDVADHDMLNGAVYFDAIFVQFYNNYCGINSFVAGSSTQNNFNFATWDNWAKTVSRNKAVKILLGVPGAPTAAGSGSYQSASAIANIIAHSKQFSSFGGVMIWDMTQVYSNAGFLTTIRSALGQPPTTTMVTSTIKPTATAKPPTTMVTYTVKPTTTPPVTPTKTTSKSGPASTTPAGTVHQWNQCGGQGWNGGTVCVAPYKCIYKTAWYSDCE